MIAKISHGSSLYGVLSYNQLKVDGYHADVLFGNRIIEPQGDAPYTVEYLSRSFEDYLTANRKTEKPILHISLNPDPKDSLNEEQFISLAEEYMRCMGFGDQPISSIATTTSGVNTCTLFLSGWTKQDVPFPTATNTSVRWPSAGNWNSSSVLPRQPRKSGKRDCLITRRLQGWQPQRAVGGCDPTARP